MLMFIVGFLAGAVVIAMVPPEYEDRLRQAILTKWQKLTERS